MAQRTGKASAINEPDNPLVTEGPHPNAMVHSAATRIARRCRHTVQSCLREEEWIDADREFYQIACTELQQLLTDRNQGR